MNLPTGYGKSLIFQKAPLVHMWTEHVSKIHWKESQKRSDSKRTIIYRQTVKQCAHLFRKFELELGSDMCDGEENPKNRLVEMLNSGSPESVKTHVLHQ